jgi:predicted Zn-dependent protease
MGVNRLKALIGAVFLAGLSLYQSSGYVLAAGDNYLCDFPEADARIYQDFRWFPGELPVSVYIPQVPFATRDPNMYVPLVRQAFGNWTQVAPALKFSFVDDPAQAQIRVVWREYFPQDEGTWGEAMFPQPYYTSQKEIRHRSELHLAVKAQPGSGMGTGAIAFNAEELMAIATHEVGHSLGLPHSRNPGDLMSPYIFKFTAKNKWGISQRDVNTLYTLYGLPKKLKVHPCKS